MDSELEIIQFLESGVFRHDGLGGKRGIDCLDLVFGHCVEIVARNMAIGRPSQKSSLRIDRVDVVLDLFEQLQRVLVVDQLNERLKVPLVESWNELGITERTVIAQIAQELGGVLQVPSFGFFTKMFLQNGVVALQCLVDGKDQVVDLLRLGRNRA
ncbi:hypothetical protein OGAPHI_005975 [Ogataea philodendri]|uniref:Uncharacterized protein n=1 Tax=Ogataea philodendri TaxID=1378263 RepID=A0A9P8NYZ6_9ASCO|nr:uncharacterized protein OGAPHI_005975 [Ogataea philodendri]KAH3661797.1 hypothetical protein OGAPHI_005975 [Ogataea philodendri]